MMETQYRGYTITFSENSEDWVCPALNLSAEKMRTIKTKIDKVVAAARKLPEEVSAIFLDHSDRVVSVKVLALAQGRALTRGAPATVEATHAWCMAPGSERYWDADLKRYAYREVAARQKLPLSQLFADTPEARDIIRELDRLRAERHQIQGKIASTMVRLKNAAPLNIGPVDPDMEG